MDPGAAADGDHRFASQGCFADNGSVLPVLLPGNGTLKAPDSGFRIGQRQAVIVFFRTSGPYGDRNGIDHQLAADLPDAPEMTGHILAHGIADDAIGHRVLAFASVGLGAPGRDVDGKIPRKAVDEDVGRPRQGFSVIQLARALRHQGHGLVPGPAALVRIRVDVFRRRSLLHGAENDGCFFAALQHPLPHGGIFGNDSPDQHGQIPGGQLGHCRRYALAVPAGLQDNRFLARAER